MGRKSRASLPIHGSSSLFSDSNPFTFSSARLLYVTTVVCPSCNSSYSFFFSSFDHQQILFVVERTLMLCVEFYFKDIKFSLSPELPET